MNGMRKTFMLVALLSSPSYAALTSFWAENGEIKMARQDLLPFGNCSTCTITPNWDGRTMKLYGARNETVGGVLYLNNGSGADVVGVRTTLSPFYLAGAGSPVLTSTAVLCANTTDYTTRPYEVFVASYVPITGLTQLSWDGTEFEQRDLPQRFRRPCTVNVNDDCVANGGTLWTDRQDHDKFYPDALVPHECISAFTVWKSSSQAIWIDVYIPQTLAAGVYTSSITVYEGASVSTTIPVSLTVRNFMLPDSPTFKAMVYQSDYNISYRHHSDHFPAANTEPYRTTRMHYAQALKRHKFAAVIGTCNTATGCHADVPPAEDVVKLNGSLYSVTSGYANAPGVGVGDELYSIGTYGSYATVWTTTDTVTFCNHLSNWGTYFKDNYPNVRSFLYVADETLTNVDKISTWMSTATLCQTAGYTVNSFVTGNWPSVQAAAPHINMPASTGWMNASEATWDTVAASYQTTGTTQAWAYNGHPSFNGTSFATEDEGVSPVVIFWADWKKGVQGHFFWESTYFTDSGVTGRNNDLWNKAFTFGAFTSTSTTKGTTGFQYSNGDGVLLYPGHDEIMTPDYGVDGPFPSWRLKMIRRGIQDMDYINAAYDAHPSATQAIVDAMVPEVLWEHECFDSGDCTYAYGGRSWSNDPNDWEQARADLAWLISNSTPKTELSGTISIKGRVTFP